MSTRTDGAVAHRLDDHGSVRRSKTRSQKEREADVLERLWGWRTCNRCGQTMMLGEGTCRLTLEKGSEDVCMDCAAAPPAPSDRCSSDCLEADRRMIWFGFVRRPMTRRGRA